jgi:hypothetical protein
VSLGALKPATEGRFGPAGLTDVDFQHNRCNWQLPS